MELVDQYPPRENEGFDCNICLDTTKDPVVTLCGHLYCWPCIYKWLNRTSKPCPVCNSPLTSTALVPLYGRGGRSSHSDLDIPKRPSPSTSSSTTTTTTSSEPRSVVDQSYEQISDMGRLFRLTSAGLVCALVPSLVGRAQSVVCYDEYDMTGSSGERLASYWRWRRERLAEVSLSRVSTFLFYCVVLCLLLF